MKNLSFKSGIESSLSLMIIVMGAVIAITAIGTLLSAVGWAG